MKTQQCSGLHRKLCRPFLNICGWRAISPRKSLRTPPAPDRSTTARASGRICDGFVVLGVLWQRRTQAEATASEAW